MVRIGIILYFACFYTFAATKYVSPTGVAAWTACTVEGTPCSKATALINATTGDEVIFLDGNYSDGLLPIRGGTCTSYNDANSTKIIFKSKNQYGAVFNESLPATRTQTNVYVQYNCIVLDGFKIFIPDQANTTYGIETTTSNYLEVKNTEILYAGTLITNDGTFKHADAIMLKAKGWIHHNIIHGTTVGVTIQGLSGAYAAFPAIVENNLVCDVIKGDLEDADCFKAVQNGATGTFAGSVFRDNECYGWVDDAFDGLSSSYVKVQHNNFHDPRGDLAAFGTTNHTTCLKPGYTSTNTQIIGNTCTGIPTTTSEHRCIDSNGATSPYVVGNLCSGGYNGIYVPQGSGTGDNGIYANNTFIGVSNNGIYIAESTAVGTVIYNNIFKAGVKDYLVTAGTSMSGKCNNFSLGVNQGTYVGDACDITSNITLLANSYPPTTLQNNGYRFWDTKPRPIDANGNAIPDYFIDIGAIQTQDKQFLPKNIK